MSIDDRLYEYIVSEESYPDKAVIIKEGTHGDWVYIVVEGRVKIKKQTARGPATIHTLGEGEIVGEMALLSFEKTRRSADVVADGPVVLGLLDRSRIDEDLNNLPFSMRKFIFTLSARLAEANQRAVAILSE